jgi:DNA-binding transcriptional LysR family regulator
LANEPFIGFAAGCSPSMHKSILQICSQAGFIPIIRHETSQINAVLRLVECGLGYSIVPCSSLNAYRLKLRSIPLSQFKEKADLRIVYKKDCPVRVNNLVECSKRVAADAMFKQ